ncbi:uncharacterized protein LOC108139277 [Drosophila elegans]|uniref:uncharacterized protein LOC108139277 n=1 Tax=Drosophila elegans TaxID=30023 RepID=UPI0007E846F3|nr:uncharacterized protein LOC108139277 [Drosophila elegans]
MSEKKSLHKKDASFKLDDDSREDLTTRSYGFLKATRTDTPIPRSEDPIVASTLEERLHTIHKHIDYQEDSDMEDTSGPGSSDEQPGRMGKTAFELKRKRFDEAEYTIARGIKLSDCFCPVNSGLQLPIIPKDGTPIALFEEMELFCRNMNIKLDK